MIPYGSTWAIRITHLPSGLQVQTEETTCGGIPGMRRITKTGCTVYVVPVLMRWLRSRLLAWQCSAWPPQGRVRDYYETGHPRAGTVRDRRTGRVVSWDAQFPERMLEEVLS